MNNNLQSLNTFGISSSTANLHRIRKLDDFAFDTYDPESWFILGGGSNILFVDEAPEHILLIENQKILYVDRGDEVHVKVQAGVNWHELVKDTLSRGYSGLENLALIPGKVGAAPIQNIGAYGVELCDRFVSLTAWDLKRSELVEFNLEGCKFGYRDSFFKTTKGQSYCVWEVTLRLDKHFKPVLGHQGLMTLEDKPELTAQEVFDSVCDIRRSKLPDPDVTGNAGSFFKNPVVEPVQYSDLLRRYSNIVAYPQQGKTWKLAAGWLIDQCGLKGYIAGNAGVHDRQALVLVNHGGATGLEIVNLARYIQDKVFEQFGVKLEPEVNIIGKHGKLSLDDLT